MSSFKVFSTVAVSLLAIVGQVQADTCNKDNCLNALSAHTSEALEFCATYTTKGQYATPAPTPTYLPSTCGPQRASSACYCADRVSNPTYTPKPCPSGQVLSNPSFYGQPGKRSIDIRPWVIAVPAGAPGCVPIAGYSTAHMDRGWGDPRSLSCSFSNNTIGGKSTVSQDFVLCPSTKYSFRLLTSVCRMSSGCDFYQSSGDFGITFRVLMGGNQIIPPTKACPACAAGNVSGCQNGAQYEDFTANFTSSASGKTTVTIEVNQPAGLVGQQVPMLLDTIYVNRIGDDTSAYEYYYDPQQAQN